MVNLWLIYGLDRRSPFSPVKNQSDSVRSPSRCDAVPGAAGAAGSLHRGHAAGAAGAGRIGAAAELRGDDGEGGMG